MKIDQIATDFIKRVVKCATIAEIDNLSIEPSLIRGMDDKQEVFLFHTDNVPKFEFGSIGLNRLSTFTSRIDLASGVTDLILDAVVDTDKTGQQFVRSINMKGKGIKIDYRCANPAVIRAPRKLQDKLTYVMDMTADVLYFMNKGRAAMGSDEVKLVCTDSQVTFEITDISGDVMECEFPLRAAGANGEKNVSFTFTYPLKTLLALFKTCPSQQFNITTPTGMLKLSVEGFDIYVLPRS
jgi:hypothetical protein